MTHRLIAISYLLTISVAFGYDPESGLSAFFEQRLASNDAPPPFNALLKVIDTISNLPPKEIQDALPSIWMALKSRKEDLAIEAVFALHEIAGRPDGGTILRFGIQNLVSCLQDPDDRLVGGSFETLRLLTVVDGDLTIPAFMSVLRSPTKASILKIEAASALLHFRPADKNVVSAVELFLSSDMDANLQAHALQVIALNRITSPKIDNFIIMSLSSPRDDVKIVAISVARATAQSTWDQALSIITKLATNSSESSSVQAAAEREIKNGLSRYP